MDKQRNADSFPSHEEVARIMRDAQLARSQAIAAVLKCGFQYFRSLQRQEPMSGASSLR
jgi:hypothetical protein